MNMNLTQDPFYLFLIVLLESSKLTVKIQFTNTMYYYYYYPLFSLLSCPQLEEHEEKKDSHQVPLVPKSM